MEEKRLTDAQAKIFRDRLYSNDGVQCFWCENLRDGELDSNCVAALIAPEAILEAPLSDAVKCYGFISAFTLAFGVSFT